MAASARQTFRHLSRVSESVPRPARRVLTVTCLWLIQTGLIFMGAVLLALADNVLAASLAISGFSLATMGITVLLSWLVLAYDVEGETTDA